MTRTELVSRYQSAYSNILIWCITTPPCAAQGSLVDLDEALTYGRCSAMSLRCRGSTKLMLGDLKVRSGPHRKRGQMITVPAPGAVASPSSSCDTQRNSLKASEP